ncbi:metalloregulator ArsR/SmtB family transcription factor [Moraxella sp. FZLJ2107]|uniref:ArsR/SmtB family transcription factor n=1 Tax=unclassified Moraxella TaxID=2685852 RepID=UPI0020C84762|nr:MULTISPECIES: metalloregulator ArsR/SmtB family transcription factor [unclassified Moraxella]UTO04693.1 metalloregulator ArsR/SmtB family transcription factor [Moraxella sp. FZLJ2107]UTO21421.1 metalloregulator ArsR/SmtB family transcription factor [Moraxella sp. FZLJ2109]
MDKLAHFISNILEMKCAILYNDTTIDRTIPMNTEQASQLFESLSSPIRLAIFQELSAMGSQGMIAGDLAKALNLAPNHLSFHLKTLTHAGLITSQQEGRFVRYYANLNLMMDLTRFLTQNCCIHSHEQCC